MNSAQYKDRATFEPLWKDQGHVPPCAICGAKAMHWIESLGRDNRNWKDRYRCDLHCQSALVEMALKELP